MPPPPLPAGRPFVAPVPQEVSLSNGARLLLVENHALPLVSIRVDLYAGIDDEPLAKRGLTWFLSSGLMEGTRTRSGADIDIAAERLATQLSTSNGYETVQVHLNALKETLPESLALLSDVLLRRHSDPGAMERLRTRLLTQLALEEGEREGAGLRGLQFDPLGTEDPRGLPSGGTPETIKAIRRADLVRFHQAWFVPNNALVTISGDTTLEEIRPLLDSVWHDWKPRTLPDRLSHPFPAPVRRRIIVFTEAPKTSQSEVLMGWRGPRLGDRDALPLLVANDILGGQFSSRLMQNIRETRGFSYGVWSSLWFCETGGTVTAGGSIQAAHAAEAVAEFEKELDRAALGRSYPGRGCSSPRNRSCAPFHRCLRPTTR